MSYNNIMDRISKIDLYLGMDEFLNKQLQGDSIPDICDEFNNLITRDSFRTLFEKIFIDTKYLDEIIPIFTPLRSEYIDFFLTMRNGHNKNIDSPWGYDSILFNSILEKDIHIHALHLSEHVVGTIILKRSENNYTFVFANSGYASNYHDINLSNPDCINGILVINNLEKNDIIKCLQIITFFEQTMDEHNQNKYSFFDLYYFLFSNLKQILNKPVDSFVDEVLSIKPQKSGSCSFRAPFMCFWFLLYEKLRAHGLEYSEFNEKVNKFYGYLGIYSIKNIIDVLTADLNLVNNSLLDCILEKIRYHREGLDESIYLPIQVKFYDLLKKYNSLPKITNKSYDVSIRKPFEFILPEAFKFRNPLKEAKIGETIENAILMLNTFTHKLESVTTEILWDDFLRILDLSLGRISHYSDSVEYNLLTMYVSRLPLVYINHYKTKKIDLAKSFFVGEKDNAYSELWNLFLIYSKWINYTSVLPLHNIYKFAFVIIFNDILKTELNEIINPEKEYVLSGKTARVIEEYLTDYKEAKLHGIEYDESRKIKLNKILIDGKLGNIKYDFSYNVNKVPIFDGMIYKDIVQIEDLLKHVNVWFSNEIDLGILFNFIYEKGCDEMSIETMTTKILGNLIKHSNYDFFKETIRNEDDIKNIGTAKSYFEEGKFHLSSIETSINIDYKSMGLYIPKYRKESILDVLSMYVQMIYSCKTDSVDIVKHNIRDSKIEKISSEYYLSTLPYIYVCLSPDEYMGYKYVKREKPLNYFIDQIINPSLFRESSELINTGINIAGSQDEKLSYINVLLKFIETQDTTYLLKGKIIPYLRYGNIDEIKNIEDDVINYQKETINYTDYLEENKAVMKGDKRLEIKRSFDPKKRIDNSSIYVSNNYSKLFLNDTNKLLILQYMEKIKSNEVTLTKLTYNIFIYMINYLANIDTDIYKSFTSILDKTKLMSEEEMNRLNNYHKLICIFVGFIVCNIQNDYDCAQRYLSILQNSGIVGGISSDKLNVADLKLYFDLERVNIVTGVITDGDGHLGFTYSTPLKKMPTISYLNFAHEKGMHDTVISPESLIYLNLMSYLYRNYFKIKKMLEPVYNELFNDHVIKISESVNFEASYLSPTNNKLYVLLKDFLVKKDDSITKIGDKIELHYDNYDLFKNDYAIRILFINKIVIDGRTYNNKYNLQQYYFGKTDSVFVNINFVCPYFIKNTYLINNYDWTGEKQTSYVFNSSKFRTNVSFIDIVKGLYYKELKPVGISKESFTVEINVLEDWYVKNQNELRIKYKKALNPRKPDFADRFIAHYNSVHTPSDDIIYKGIPKNIKINDFFNYKLEIIFRKNTSTGEIMTSIMNECGYRLVDYFEILNNSDALEFIEMILKISTPENTFIWEKNGAIKSVDLMNYKMTITNKDGKYFINNDYEIINSDDWMVQKWIINVDNLWLVKDKNNNIFIVMFKNINGYKPKNNFMFNDKEIINMTKTPVPFESKHESTVEFIPINMMTKIPVITNKDTLLSLINSYLMFYSVGNVIQLENIVGLLLYDTDLEYSGPFSELIKSIIKKKYDGLHTYYLPYSLMSETKEIKITTISSKLKSYYEIIIKFLKRHLNSHIMSGNTGINIYDMPYDNNFVDGLLFFVHGILKNSEVYNYIGLSRKIAYSRKSITVNDILTKHGIINRASGSVALAKFAKYFENYDDMIAYLFGIFDTLEKIIQDKSTVTSIKNNILTPIKPFVINNYNNSYKVYSDVLLNNDLYMYNYYFPRANNEIIPTQLEYNLYTLFDTNRKIKDSIIISDYAFSLYFNNLKKKYESGTEEMRSEIAKIMSKLKEGKYIINAYEFYYQYILGFFARDEQMDMTLKITEDVTDVKVQYGGNNILHKLIKYSPMPIVRPIVNKCMIHNLIMGGGKTSMITPLTILRYIQEKSILEINENNIYLILPENLVYQSYTHLLKTLGSYYPIKIKMIKENRSQYFEYTQSLTKSNDGNTYVYVMSDTSMKCGFINNYKLIRENYNKHIYLFDEVDTILNPNVSELNYPIDSKEQLRNYDDFFDIFYEILIKIYFNRNTELKEILTEFSDDWTDYPHFNVINAKSPMIEKIQNYAKNIIIKYYIGIGDTNIYKILQGETIDGIEQRDVNVLYVIYNFINETLPSVMTFINRKNYGLSDSKSVNIAIPFTYAEVPKNGSQFSNPIIILSLTILDYLLQIKQLPHNIINKMIELIYNLYLAMPPEFRSESELYKEYINLNLGIAIHDLNNTLLLTKNQIEKLSKNSYFIKLICKQICYDEIEVETTQLNISGLDLIMSFNIKNKSGFTGTPSIATFYELDDANKMTVEAIDENTYKVINEALVTSELKIYDDAKQLDYLKDILMDNLDANVLIDIGATLVGLTPEIIHKMINNIEPKRNISQFIYWNNEHKPFSINQFGIIHEWDRSMTDNMFYYYDNQHTTGIDAVIPLGYKGLALLGKNSRYRDVVQGIFRMRKLTKGHTIRFIINKKIESYIKKMLVIAEVKIIDLIKWFAEEENSILKNQNEHIKLQNMRALFRKLYDGKTSTNDYIKKKIVNPFLIYNSFRYPSVDEIKGNIKLLTNEETYNDIEIEGMKEIFKDYEMVYTNLLPEIKVLNIGTVEKVTMEESEIISERVRLDEDLNEEIDLEIQNKLLEILKYDKDDMVEIKSFIEYLNPENPYYSKVTDLVYFSKNMKFYKPPYMVLHNGKNIFFIPFIEGIKIIDSIMSGKIILGEIKLTILDTLGIIYYTNITDKGSNKKIQTIVRFILRRIDNTAYISIRDYVNLLYSEEKYRKAIEYVINGTSTTDAIFNKFSRCFKLFNENATAIYSILETYNKKILENGISKCKVIVNNLVRDITDPVLGSAVKIVIDFLTNDTNLCYEINQTGGTYKKNKKYKLIKDKKLKK
jgi:hypothetical protein